MTVLVVGGGITGLVATYELVRAGAAVTLIEATDRLGGKVRTDRVEGYLVEQGPDSFVSYRPAARMLAEELGLGDQLIAPTQPRLVHLRRHGRMLPLPTDLGVVLPTRLRPLVTTPLFSWPQKARAGLDLLLPRRLPADDVPVGEFLRARLGRAVVEQLADPLFGGVYGTSVDELSLDAVLPMLREHERSHRSLILASLAQGRTARAAAAAGGRPAGSAFLSLAGGLGALVEALVAAITGAEVRLSTSVTGLTRLGPGRTGGRRTVATLSDGSRVEAEAVVLACPAPVTSRLVADELPEVADLVAGIRHASTGVVSLGYPLDSFASPPVGHGFLEAGPVKAVFSGCTFSSEKWPGRAEAGRVLIRAFVPNRSAALLARSDAEVFAAVERELAPVIGGSPEYRGLARWCSAMPIYAVGHRERVGRVRELAAAAPEWQLAGASYGGVGLPDCVAAGRSAATAVLAG